jgi:hypothetical protein
MFFHRRFIPQDSRSPWYLSGLKAKQMVMKSFTPMRVSTKIFPITHLLLHVQMKITFSEILHICR